MDLCYIQNAVWAREDPPTPSDPREDPHTSFGRILFCERILPLRLGPGRILPRRLQQGGSSYGVWAMEDPPTLFAPSRVLQRRPDQAGSSHAEWAREDSPGPRRLQQDPHTASGPGRILSRPLDPGRILTHRLGHGGSSLVMIKRILPRRLQEGSSQFDVVQRIPPCRLSQGESSHAVRARKDPHIPSGQRRILTRPLDPPMSSEPGRILQRHLGQRGSSHVVCNRDDPRTSSAPSRILPRRIE